MMMMISRLKFLLLSMIILLCTNVIAQTTDFATWTSIEFTHSFNKDLKFGFQQQLRLDEGSTHFKSTFSDFNLGYDLNKHWSIACAYRMITTPLDLQHRFYGDVSYGHKFHKFSTTLRLRYQKQFEIANLPQNYIRPKIGLKYKYSKQIIPYSAFESGYRIYYKGSRFDFYRFYLGCEFNFSKHMGIDLYYLLTGEFNVNDPTTTHVAGVNLAFDF